MRILHTADWHMNDRLGRIDRDVDIRKALEQIARYLDERQVDVMLVAGDLFDRSDQEQMRQGIEDIKKIFLPFLERGGTMIAISGNHDSEIFFETLRDALDLAAPGRTGASGTNATGRLYIAPNPRLLHLVDRTGGSVQFALMPYPTPRCYLGGERIQYRTIEEKHRTIQQAFTRTLGTLKERIDPHLPSVLVSHVHVRGAKVHSLYRISESDDVIFEPSDIPSYWAYIAYGHIHEPQPAVAGAKHIRYAGSIERLDASEQGHNKSVVLFNVGPTGLQGEPELLPLDSTPIYQIEITDPDAQLPTLVDLYPHADRALVKYTLHWDVSKHNLDALRQAVQSVFPRWYQRDDKEIGSDDARVATLTPQRMQDVVGTVREYLGVQLTTHHHRDELLELAEALLAEGS